MWQNERSIKEKKRHWIHAFDPWMINNKKKPPKKPL